MDPNDSNQNPSAGTPAGGSDVSSIGLNDLYGPSTPVADAPPADPSASSGQDALGTTQDYAATPTDQLVDQAAGSDTGSYDQTSPDYVPPQDPNAAYDESATGTTQDTIAESTDNLEQDAGAYDQYYQEDQNIEGVPLDPNAGMEPPTDEVPQPAPGSLPPVPSRSKLPLLIIGAVVGVLLISSLVLFLMLRGGRSTGGNGPKPIPTEEPLTCEEDPQNPDCITGEPTAGPTDSGTFTPPPTIQPSNKSCKLLGTC